MAKRAFTLDTPVDFPVERKGEHWWFVLGDRRVRLSNLDKVFWRDEGYTKGDLLAYYHAVAPVMLPYLAGRPLTMKRMPDGAGGPFFYEKNAPQGTPDWMPRCPVRSDDSTRGVIDYLMVDDIAAQLFVANLGCIEFHPLHSRCVSIDRPDYLFFDLDPFEPATFADVLAVAHHVRAALDTLGLPSYPKTSGATGMQIYVPIVPGPSYDQIRSFVGAVGRAIRDVDRERVTMEPRIVNRTGKVFIDHNMNREGANIAAVYSVRPEPGASVSTPLRWEEVEAGAVRPQDFTIATIHDRLAEAGDLFTGLLRSPVDLRPALERVGLPAGEDTTVRDRLQTYEAKRDFSATPEPAGGEEPEHGNRFVIQKHAARRLHYDLRLERDGVLASWAVPRGMPTTPGERRLAVRTEDHPVEYLDFHGVIPKGHYGAGEMVIFDRGTYEAPEWEDGKLTVRLHGERVRGEYHLVRTREGWLIFLSKRSAALQPPPPPAMRPMLAETWPEPFDDPQWTFEPKLDGVRTLAYVTTGGTTLVSRSGRDQTVSYPELANLATYVNAIQAVLDGEIVAHDENDRPSFGRLQQRINLSSESEIARIRQRIPVRLYVFDLLWLDDSDLTGEPLEERRRVLHEVVTEDGPVRLSFSVEGNGRSFFQATKQLGIEGMVAKRLGSPYLPGRRSRDWRKVKIRRSQSCVILGWTPGGGSRSASFGALLVGAYVDGELRWIGQVGSGFTGQTQDATLTRLREIETKDPPIADRELRAVKGAHWVRPELVCEVEYAERTVTGKLRAPAFKGLRPDKTSEDCVLEPAPGDPA